MMRNSLWPEGRRPRDSGGLRPREELLAALADHSRGLVTAPNGRKSGRLRKVADAAKARQLRDKGIAAIDIAMMLGVSRATVYRYLANAGA